MQNTKAFWEREIEWLTTELGIYGAWRYAGIDCEIQHTGGNIYVVVHHIDKFKTAVASEHGDFTIFTDGEDWNEWMPEYDGIGATDYVAQIKAIRKETK